MLKQVTLDKVVEFKGDSNVSGSYMQDSRHVQVSDKFQVIQAASVGAALAERGFNLTGVISGRSKHADKSDFQRTIGRYRSKDAFEIEGLSMDIIYISKHLGRGCDELRLGLFRGVCANQWNFGTLFEVIKFRHTGNASQDIEDGILRVAAQRTQLVDTIKKMQQTVLSPVAITELAKRYAAIRLEGKDNVIDVDFKRLGTVHRAEDAKLDLWTVANVLQENVIRFPLGYRVESKRADGSPMIRNMTTRQFRESSAQLVDLNGKLFDAAQAMIA